MDGSLVGIEFTAYIAVAWSISGLLLAALAGWAVAGYRRASKGADNDGH